MTECAICGIVHSEQGNYPSNEPRVLLTSYPKCGTSMALQFLGQPAHIQISHNILYAGIPIRAGNEGPAMNHLTYDDVYRQLHEFTGAAFGHVPYTDDIYEAVLAERTVVVLLVRDPRDVVISHYFHAKRMNEAVFNFIFENGKHLMERPDPIGDLIRISPAMWEHFAPWLEKADMVVRFEGMIVDPLYTCQQIVNHVGPHLLGTAEKMVIRQSKEKSPTFRKGVAGDWVNHFTTEHMRDYMNGMSQIHRQLGYFE